MVLADIVSCRWGAGHSRRQGAAGCDSCGLTLPALHTAHDMHAAHDVLAAHDMQDYHLMLLPAILKETKPRMKVRGLPMLPAAGLFAGLFTGLFTRGVGRPWCQQLVCLQKGVLREGCGLRQGFEPGWLRVVAVLAEQRLDLECSGGSRALKLCSNSPLLQRGRGAQVRPPPSCPPHTHTPTHPPLQVGFFLHTPFPSSEIYRTLPVREELLRSGEPGARR